MGWKGCDKGKTFVGRKETGKMEVSLKKTKK